MAGQAEIKKQLKSMMKEYGLALTNQVRDELLDDLLPKSVNFTNQGEKCSPGQEGCVALADMEAIWGQNNLLAAHFLTEGAAIQKAVAMVTLKVPSSGLPAGNGWGSGFLISNSLFMTNNHVIPDKEFCAKINMQFMYQDNFTTSPAIQSEFFETNENAFFHTNASLDYTIVRLRRKPYKVVLTPKDSVAGDELMAPGYIAKYEFADSEQIAGLEYLKEIISKKEPVSAIDPSKIQLLLGYTAGSRYGFIPLRPTISYPVGLRLNIIQHPCGRKKEVVLQQNELKDVHENVIHYFSDTDYGSSGSPVFNNTWDLMALHHARHPTESANEGIRIDRIAKDLRNQFKTSMPSILTELGI
jgi:hypothetical protein